MPIHLKWFFMILDVLALDEMMTICPASLESRKLIPIISEVSEMNAKKTRRNS